MNVAVSLIGFAVLIALCAPFLLLRGWAMRYPRLALTAWHVTVFSILTALMWALLVVSHFLWIPAVASLLHIEAPDAHDAYSTATYALDSAIWLLVAVASWMAVVGARKVIRVRRASRDYQLNLTALAVPQLVGSVSGVYVLTSPEPAVFCVPGGRSPMIVVTSAARDQLTSGQLRAAIAHERAHLRHRHQLAITWADTISAAFAARGLISVFAHYPVQVRRLCEMAADDSAARSHGNRDLSTALLSLSAPRDPGFATLGAHGGSVAERITRLLPSAPRSGTGVRCAVIALTTVVLLAPAAMAWIPALHLAGSDHCSAHCVH
ncbi:MAG: M56 family metallopeptidase [Actinobacteria bacterium]|nr:M56 family metallopeptidase [Actinomycetota bacterium]